MLTDVRLTGPLVDVVGREVLRLDVDSPREAVYALTVLYPRTRQVIEAHDWRIGVGDYVLDGFEGIDIPPRGNPITLYVMPEAAGSSGVSGGKIGAGIGLILLTLVVPALAPATSAFGVILFGLGASVALGGLAQILAPSPSTDYGAGEETEPSFLFHGAVNLVREGAPIGLAYGHTLTGSTVASSGFTTVQRGTTVQGEEHLTVNEFSGAASVSIARVIDVISEGEIDEILTTYLDDSPIQEEVHQDQSTGVPWEDSDEQTVAVARGTSELIHGPDQVPIPQSTPATVTITNEDADLARVTVRVPRLYIIHQGTGQWLPYPIDFEIAVGDPGGPHTAVPIGTSTTRHEFVGDRFTPIATDWWKVVVWLYWFGLPFRLQTSESWKLEYRFRWRTGGGAWTEDLWRGFSAGLLNDKLVQTPWIISPSVSVWEWELAVRDKTGEWNGGAETNVPRARVDVLTRDPGTNLRLNALVNDNNFLMSFDVPLPSGDSPWEIEVTRKTQDPDNQVIFSEMYLHSVQVVTLDTFTFPDVAFSSMSYDAELTAGQIGTRKFEVRGIKVQVPNGIDLDTLEYPDPWDGTFEAERAFSQNPALIIFDLLTHPRYGLGLDASQVDQYSFFEAARYCEDSAVDGNYTDGRRVGMIPISVEGAMTELAPRFTFGGVLNTHEEPAKAITAIASAGHMQIWWGSDGKVYATQDRPSDPVRLFSNANVIGGIFEYTGAARKTKVSVCNVTWWDRDNLWEEAVEVVENADLLERFGYVKEDVTAYGKGYIWEAHREGVWRLDTVNAQSTVATFKCGAGDVALAPGDVIAIADQHYAKVRAGGRVKSELGSIVIIDGPGVDLEADKDYTLSVQMTDDSIEVVTVTNAKPASDVTAFSVSPALVESAEVGAAWVLQMGDVEPRQFRVLAAEDVGDGELQVTAVFHDPDKYDRIEYGIDPIKPRTYISTTSGQLQPPTSITATAHLTRGPHNTFISNILVGWPASPDGRVGFYEMSYRKDTDGFWFRADLTSQATHLIEDVDDGETYLLRVRTVDHAGQRHSEWATHSVYVNILSRPPRDPTGAKDGEVSGTGSDPYSFNWRPNTDLGVWRYEVRYTRAATPRWGASALAGYVQHPEDGAPVSRLNATDLITYLHQFPREGTLLVKAVNYIGTMSTGYESSTFTTGTDPTADQEFTEGPTWTGTHLATQEVSNELRLADAGGGLYVESGLFAPDAQIDLGTSIGVASRHLSADIQGTGLRASFPMDAWGVLDDVDPLDGNAETGFDVSIIVSTSDDAADSPDAGSWSVYRPLESGEYVFRHAKFILVLTSTDGGHTSPSVEEVTIWAD